MRPLSTFLVGLVSSQYAILDGEALLHIIGPDTLAFLQGQTTCDTRLVDDEHAILGAYCTPKGRVVCDFLLCKISENHYAMRMRRDILDSSAAVFGKYIVFSKAELQPDSQSWQLYGCWGEDARSALQAALGPLSFTSKSERYVSACGEGFVIIQTNEDGTQFECYINTQSHPELADRLAEAMTQSDVNNWLGLQIKQGIARIEAATTEEFIPQMLNYDLTGHISFNKGCYTGQEVVARLHYRGKPKRRLFEASTDQGSALLAGTPLYSEQSQQSAGTVVNSAVDADGLATSLIVAPVEKMESGLHLGDPEGAKLAYDSTG
jgi:folate-binding protein YgfZ